jgi:probable rRNA maturation factor
MLIVTFYIKRRFTFPVKKIKKLVETVCRCFDVTDAIIDIAVVDNKLIRKLNEKFLHRRAATDCLAFDMSLPDGRRFFEIIVNGQKAKSEAAKRGHSAQAELALYITHGLLHNLGFEDNTPKKASRMHRLEDEILTQQGFGLVYQKKRC